MNLYLLTYIKRDAWLNDKDNHVMFNSLLERVIEAGRTPKQAKRVLKRQVWKEVK